MNSYKIRNTAAISALFAIGFISAPAQADQVFLDDLIVDGSACIGMDCVNGEVFGFDTLRLKENNLRIGFDDTSASASFPANDWQITINDSENGGANKFSIDDITGVKTPFTIEANAPSNSLYVDDGGRIGVGTAAPSTTLHGVTGNTPTLRLEQDGSSGFTPQTWDLAGNESNFFVRDATNGGTLPFRIQPGSPSDAIYIEDTGDIGFGTASPTAPLHVQSAGGGNQTMLLLNNSQGRARVELMGAGNAGQTGHWSYSGGRTFVIKDEVNTNNAFILDQAGNLTITGALTEGSDRNNKVAFEEVDSKEILAKVAALPVSTWSYKGDHEMGIRHIGPMAQDFYAMFGTGASERGISGIDSSGVALAAIQALSSENQDLKSRIEALEARLTPQ